MKELAFIQVGTSRYEDRLWQILEETGLERDDFEDLDYFSLLPFFVLAGASVTSEVESHGDHFHFTGVRISIADDMEEPFYAALPQMLSQLLAEADDE